MLIRAYPRALSYPHSLVAGTGGRLPLEPVAVFNQSGWSSSIGIGGRHHPVCALRAMPPLIPAVQ
jgi:hypothetical protein